jgi:hypothetical protein
MMIQSSDKSCRAREIEQRIIRRQELARRLAFGGIATALRERDIRQVAVDHETVTLQRPRRRARAARQRQTNRYLSPTS